MRNILTIFLIVMGLLAAPAIAKTLNASDAQGLQAVAFVSGDNKFIENWHKTPVGKAPYIKAVREVAVAQALTAGFLASGMQKDATGNYLVVFDVSIINPQGQTVVDEPNYGRAAGKLEKGDAFVLADPALNFQFSNQDAKGQYTLEVTAKDQVAGTQTASTYIFTLN